MDVNNALDDCGLIAAFAAARVSIAVSIELNAAVSRAACRVENLDAWAASKCGICAMALCVIEWTDRVHGQEIKVSILPYPFNIRRWSIAAAGFALLAGTACQIGATPAADPMPSATPAPMASTSVSSTNADERQLQASGSASVPTSSRPAEVAAERAAPGLSASDAPTLPELIPPDKPFALAEGVPEELAVVW